MPAFFPEPDLHDFPDRAIRNLLEFPAHLREVVQAVRPEVAALLDFDRAEVLRRDLPMPDWRKRETDLLFRVPLLDARLATTGLVCVLIEHASQPDQTTPLRSLLYAVLFWERQWENWEKERKRGDKLRLSPVLPIVFATCQQRWEAPLGFLELFGDPGPLRPFIPAWQPLLWEVSARTPGELLQMPGEWLPALAVVCGEEAEEAEFQSIFAEVMRRLEPLHSSERVRWNQLMWFLLSWAVRRLPSAERGSIVRATTAVLNDVSLQQEILNMAGFVGQRMEEEFFARGRVAASRGHLRRVLESRQFVLTPEFIRKMEAITDANRLEQLFEQALTVQRLEELNL